MKIGLQIPDFSTPRGPERLGAELATVARTADDAGFEYIAVMDHFFQIPAVGPAERGGDALGVNEREPLGHELPQDQREIRDADHDGRHADDMRVSRDESLVALELPLKRVPQRGLTNGP